MNCCPGIGRSSKTWRPARREDQKDVGFGGWLPIAETARLNGHNPEAYIAMVLDRLAKGQLPSSITELLPWNITPDDQPVGKG